MVVDFLADYYCNVTNYPVLSQVAPNYLRKILPESAPFNPQPIEAILQDVQQHIIPGITHWLSPNYFAYFPSSASTAGILGEMLSTGLSVNGFNWASSPAATELESIVMDWIGQELKLPEAFLFSGKAQIAGIHPKNLLVIETYKSTSFALSPESLLSTILLDVENGLIPCFLCATVGTTATTAIDPIWPLCNVAKKFGIWVHVDAAYADRVDYTKSLTTYPSYLRNKASDSKQVIDYKDWQIALSKKFNALKLWIVLRSYGIGNLRNFIRNYVKMAKTFEELVKMDRRFEIFVPRTFSLVCFRLKQSAIATVEPNHNETKAHQNEDFMNQVNSKLLDLINGSGKVFLTHAVVAGAFVLRCVFSATLTEEKHVIMMWKVVQEKANSLLDKPIITLS
ncbi:hypothetical protein L6164_000272 [Bauhinia variegata]|uniref:Uncharacterized protein n=1 Tax=Bauhinia variegata TaxID=167791 RepID=A0ACB9Q6M6_BAUVA|nr:hypothetical protein L6164_000272 [Bauhinia variegata]